LTINPRKKPREVGGKLSALFDLEDGVDVFLRSVGINSEINGVTAQTTANFILCAARTSNPV
jgi:hypothetical protein